jgi:acetyl-CoA carboxylase biotin carboxyl carrier protein
MNLKEIKDLIELVDDKGFAEFEIERQGFRLRISRFRESHQIIQPATPPIIISSPVPATSGSPATAAPASLVEPEEYAAVSSEAPARTAEDSVSAEPGLHIIKSPIVGTFYSAPSPDSEPFVRMGDHIRNDTVVCIIEAMKLMNEIQAEVNGEVSRIYVENGQPVEYGQALFGIKTT